MVSMDCIIASTCNARAHTHTHTQSHVILDMLSSLFIRELCREFWIMQLDLAVFFLLLLLPSLLFFLSLSLMVPVFCTPFFPVSVEAGSAGIPIFRAAFKVELRRYSLASRRPNSQDTC